MMSPEQFDKDYVAWLDKQRGRDGGELRCVARAVEGAGGDVGAAKDDDGVIAAAPAVIKLYPEYVGDANAYELLANAQLAKGNKQAAAGCAAG